jgi:hypothetical protein
MTDSLDQFVLIKARKSRGGDHWSSRFVIGGLQKKNHGDHDGELKKGKSYYAPYRSCEQFDHAHGCS